MSEEDISRQTPESLRASTSADPASVHREIERYASEVQARFGAPGTLRVEGDSLMLHAPQGSLQVGLEGLDKHWPHLSDELRRRRAADLVRRLMARRSTLPSRSLRRRTSTTVWLLGIAAAGLAGWFAWQARPGPPTEVVRRTAAANSAPEEGRQERAQRVCERTRARVLRGATVGVADSEGWNVDVLLLKWGAEEPLDRHSGLDEFFQRDPSRPFAHFIWPKTPALLERTSSETGVELVAEPIEGSSGTRGAGLRLSFRGELAIPYFREEERVHFFHVANAISDRLGATHTGIVARCAGGDTHHIGSWFRGDSVADAATALIYLLGTYTEPPHLADPFLRPLGAPSDTSIDRAYAFAAIREATAKLDQRAVAELVGKSGGMITTPSGNAIITFPFTDGNRGSRASRDVARAVHVGRF